MKGRNLHYKFVDYYKIRYYRIPQSNASNPIHKYTISYRLFGHLERFLRLLFFVRTLSGNLSLITWRQQS